MGKQKSKQVSFRISSRTARMLGRQNVSNQHVAVIELIKNAYDADSNFVEVIFTNADTPEGSIVIKDRGTGMDISVLEESWLTLGTDFKERKPHSPNGRVRTGAKGIGRFALDRLGGVGVLETFTSSDEDGIRVTVDWSKYDNNQGNFESVTHDLEFIENRNKITGTTLTITQLRDTWYREDYAALHDDLTFLIPPLDNYQSGFEIRLIIDALPELSGIIQPLVKEAAEYELISELDIDGVIKHSLIHKRDGELEEMSKEWKDVPTADNRPRVARLFDNGPSCGPLKLHLLFFLRSSSDDRNLDFNLTSLRKYLDVFSGVRLYRDGFQIKPYGSKGNDWLGLNGRKARSPEGVGQDLGRYRVSSNQLVGTVSVGREDNANLQDKANREGIIETQAFQDLKDFLLDGIRFLELQRQEKERRSGLGDFFEDKRIRGEFRDLSKSFEELIKTPIQAYQTPSYDKGFPLKSNEAIINKEDLNKVRHQLTDLQEDWEVKLKENQLLRALATIGITLSTFSHEIQASVSSISNELALSLDLVKLLPEPEKSKALERLKRCLSASDRIQQWSDYVLESVQARHRKEQELCFKDVLERILGIFQPSLDFRSIKIKLDLDPKIPKFYAFPIDIEAILINLLSNAVKALETGVDLHKRWIRITAKFEGDSGMLRILFMDSGKGIDLKNLPIKRKGIGQVFEPFVTGSGETGTGMGLAVVSKIIRGLGLGGSIDVDGQGELGGATFKVAIPLQLEIPKYLLKQN